MRTAEAEIATLRIRKEPENDLRRRIVVICCDAYGVTLREMFSERKYYNVAWARQLAMAIFREPGMVCESGMSLKSIAEYFGRKDHATVVHAVKMVNQRKEWPCEGPKLKRLFSVCEHLRLGSGSTKTVLECNQFQQRTVSASG